MVRLWKCGTFLQSQLGNRALSLEARRAGCSINQSTKSQSQTTSWCWQNYQNNACQAPALIALWLCNSGAFLENSSRQGVIMCIFAWCEGNPSCPDTENHCCPSRGEFWGKSILWPTHIPRLKQAALWPPKASLLLLWGERVLAGLAWLFLRQRRVLYVMRRIKMIIMTTMKTSIYWTCVCPALL